MEWEYLVEMVYESATGRHLNMRGRQGWELVAVTRQEAVPKVELFLKRPAPVRELELPTREVEG